MAFETKQLRRIGLISQQTLVRCLSPELMLVDPELARWARDRLREPNEASGTNGKGWYMSALGTHEITAGIGMGLEPPLSPPVVRGPNAQMPQPDFSDLPTPPPAIRPPESAMQTPDPVPASEPEQSQPEPVIPLQPAAQPEPVQAEPIQPEPELPAVAPEPALPAMAPEPALEPAPVQDYFAATAPTPEPTAEPQPVEQAPAEPVELPKVEPIPLVAPAPAEPPAAELPPLVAPPAPEPAPEPVLIPEISLAEIAPEPELVEQEPELVAEEPVPTLPALEPELPAAELDLPVTEMPTAPEPVPTFQDPFARSHGLFRVVVRLRDSEGVEIGEFRDFGTAMEGAQEVIEQFSAATDTNWPFYAGRFIRPDLIVSVDVVEGHQD
jgi:hypothetical protein